MWIVKFEELFLVCWTNTQYITTTFGFLYSARLFTQQSWHVSKVAGKAANHERNLPESSGALTLLSVMQKGSLEISRKAARHACEACLNLADFYMMGIGWRMFSKRPFLDWFVKHISHAVCHPGPNWRHLEARDSSSLFTSAVFFVLNWQSLSLSKPLTAKKIQTVLQRSHRSAITMGGTPFWMTLKFF